MRYSKEHKEETRQRILRAAGRVFRRQGYQGGGVDAVMKEAGLTHGGFYAHFKNKEALFEAAISAAMHGARETHQSWTQDRVGDDWIRTFTAHYLSPQHAERQEGGCAVPPLVSELGRAGEGPRVSFGNNIQEWAASLAEHLPGKSESVDDALAVIAACVGGIALARAVDDPELQERILSSSRRMIDQAFLETSPTPAESSQTTAHEGTPHDTP